jgi:hypothetical protein
VGVKHFLPLVLLLALLSSAASAAPLRLVAAPAPARSTDTVYVCMSKTSYAYHASDRCQGLNRCTHEVKTMRAAEAQKLGKRACLKCH